MKQNITREQYQELNKEQQEKLFYLFFPQLIENPDSLDRRWMIYDINPEYVTIGRMIEFLDEHKKGWQIVRPYPTEKDQRIFFCMENWVDNKDELVDALWLAVKQVLEVNNG